MELFSPHEELSKDIKKAVKVEEEPKKWDPSWNKYVGVYKWSDGALTQVMLLNKELVFIDPASDNPWENRIRLEFVTGQTFKMVNQEQEGELVTFETDEKGKVKQAIFPGYSMIKIE